MLLYYLVSGQYPVDGKTLGDLKRAHEALRIRALDDARPDLPRPLVDIIGRATEREPALRPGTTEIQSALSAVAMDDTALVGPSFRKWWLAAAAAAVLMATVLIAPLFRQTAAPLPAAQSIAVLPIKNLTGDPSKQYLADGMTEVLTAYLARLPGLQVASSAMTAAVGRTAADEKALARTLGVRLLLAGSVLQADDRIALSVKLTDAVEGREIWGTELERAADNILSARSEIAALLAARLSLEKIPADATGQQPSREAQDAFLSGLAEFRYGPNAKSTGRAIDLFSRASALAPTWAEPLAHLAYTQQLMIEFGNPFQRGQAAAVVRANALKALEMDPGLSLAYTALAAVQAHHDWDFKAAEATLRHAVDVDPRDGTARGRLVPAAAQGRLPEAIAEARRRATRTHAARALWHAGHGALLRSSMGRSAGRCRPRADPCAGIRSGAPGERPDPRRLRETRRRRGEHPARAGDRRESRMARGAGCHVRESWASGVRGRCLATPAGG